MRARGLTASACLAACIATIFVAELAGGTTWVKQPVWVYYQNAEVVARIAVKRAEAIEAEHEGRSIWCTTRVVADVLETLKGEAKTVEFQIEGMVLNLGEEYLVFLESPSAPDVSPMASTNSFSRSAELIRRQACAGTAAGLQANWLSTSRFVSRWSQEAREYEPWVMPAHNILVPEDAGLEFKQVELRSLMIDGEVVENELWSVSDQVPMPHDFWMYRGAYSWESYRRHILTPKSQAPPE